jgi:CRISPR/Cas system-associated exonuclease Cas4 (RecB family)
MVMQILDAERETTIKDAIHQELARALHDEKLDIQQSQISITLGQQISMATSMDELLMTCMEQTKLEYKTLKHHQKELAATNEHLAKELSRVQTSLEQVQQLEQQVWTKQQVWIKHHGHVIKAEQDHKATFNAMLEKAKTHSLATL